MNWIFNLISMTSIWVLGLTIATQPGMILFIFRQLADKKESSIYDAMIRCHWCMPSIHGLFGYLFAYGTGVITEFSVKQVIAYPIVVCGSSFIVGFLWVIYIRLDEWVKSRDLVEEEELQKKLHNSN